MCIYVCMEVSDICTLHDATNVTGCYKELSPNAWVRRSKKPSGRYYSYHSVVTITSPCPETQYSFDLSMWEINKLYPILVYLLSQLHLGLM